MKVYAISLLRDEEDIVSQAIDNQIANNVDGIIVSDIMSEDHTMDILKSKIPICKERGIDYVIIEEKQFGYFQAIKYNGMAKLAAERANDKTMIIPFDCDEFWTCPRMPLADFLKTSEIEYWWVGMWNFIITAKDDPNENDPIARMKWYLSAGDPRMEISNVKVIYVCGPNVWLELGAHRTRNPSMDSFMPDGGHRGPHIHHTRAGLDQVLLRHYPVRSFEQMKRKYHNNAAAMAASTMGKTSANRHSVERGAYNEEQMKELFSRQHYSRDPVAEKLNYDGK